MKGILGRKLGMTQVFTTDGKLVPVTVVECASNIVTQQKTMENDGYVATQVGFEDKKERNPKYGNGFNKPEKGHFDKANTNPKRFVREFKSEEMSAYEIGSAIKVDIFEAGDIVDVTGTSKGKGFQGAIKRHGQSRGPMAHGSRYHRRPGSMGAVAANRVFKGKKLPGHMGVKRTTVQNLVIVAVDVENNLLLVKGNIPGPKKGLVMVKEGIKTLKNKEKETFELVDFTPVVEEVKEEVKEEVVAETAEAKEE
ncbi:large subunit ribosomal protein L3 [Bacilli bacterium PM5-3]|nr:large subunit ribosomal protein L3 [Bacilli bacterium PM5-3]MDH6604184.1 large subunit ribosomal protein L3 [Bacilli bacterium PM5-9]